MFTDPMFYEDTDDNLTEEERARKAALPKQPLAYKPIAPAVAKPVDLQEPDPDSLPPLGLITDDNPPKTTIDTPRWSARDQFNEDIKTEPKLERPKGWKGGLQRAGEVAAEIFAPRVAGQLLHPKYTDQMRQYERKIGQDVDLMKSEETAEENRRKQTVAERQIAASGANEAAARAREALAEKQAAEVGKPKPQNVISVNSPAIYDPNTKQWSENPYYQAKAGSWQQKLDAMTEQMKLVHPEWGEDEARQAAAGKLQELSDSVITRNKMGAVAAGAGAGLSGANTSRVNDEVERRALQDRIDADAAKAVSDAKDDYPTASKNVMNRDWYGHIGDETYRARVADKIRELGAKRVKRTNGLLARAKGDGSAPATGGQAAPAAKRIATKADVQSFAKAHGMTYEQAKNAATKEGWTVQE